MKVKLLICGQVPINVITAPIRRMTGGYIFTLCVSSHGGGGTYLPRSG